MIIPRFFEPTVRILRATIPARVRKSKDKTNVEGSVVWTGGSHPTVIFTNSLQNKKGYCNLCLFFRYVEKVTVKKVKEFERI